MVNTGDLYTELLEAVGNQNEMFDVGEDLMEAALESDLVDMEYKTTDTSLAVGEDIVDESRFFTDSIQVQNLGMSAGARVRLNGSYYDRVNNINELTPAPNMSASKGQVVTVNVQLTLTINQQAMEGEGLVLFSKGRD